MVEGANPEDGCWVKFSSMIGDSMAFPSANVATAGRRVRVLSRNAGQVSLALPAGVVSVVVTQFV